jgi:hypothetical protein
MPCQERGEMMRGFMESAYRTREAHEMFAKLDAIFGKRSVFEARLKSDPEDAFIEGLAKLAAHGGGEVKAYIRHYWDNLPKDVQVDLVYTFFNEWKKT